MTELLYMESIEGNYISEFDAEVVKSKEEYVVLNKTAFYPEGGGQPSDKGSLKWRNIESEVTHAVKRGVIKHILKAEKPEVGEKVHGTIDWQRRYAHMKMHTAQHIISGVVFDEYDARTVGNQIYADYSRVDFSPVTFSDENLKHIAERCNEIIGSNLPVKIYSEDRLTLEKRVDEERCNLDLIPKLISVLRIVEIENFDVCPCAGTHVRNTSEIPFVKIIKKENKGKDRDRIIYSFSRE